MTTTDADIATVEARLIENARGLESVILDNAEEAERTHTQPAAVIDAMRAAQSFLVWLPKSSGGLELPQTTYTRVLEAISQHDGSAGWTAMIGMANNSFAGWLSEEGAKEIFDDHRLVAASTVGSGLTAEPVPGGYKVSGQWTFVSGLPHSEWAGGLIDSPPIVEGGPPSARMFHFPPGDYEMIETWESGGLRGTGSHDFVVRDVFVPEHRVFDFFQPAREPGTFWQLGFPEFLQMAHTGQALGTARGAIDTFLGLSGESRSNPNLQHNARPLVQIQVGEAEATLRAARAWVFETLEMIWKSGEEGRVLDPRERALVTLCVAHTVQSCIRAVDLIYQAGGSKSLYTARRIERFWRDMHAAGQHVSASAQQYHNSGAVLMGLPHPNL